jgi:hypothetical protein
MKPLYYNLHRFYRQTIAPKAGESHEVRGFMVNLMYASATHEGPFDVMDYIWNEMINIVKDRRSCAYAPYLHALICHVCAQDVPPVMSGLRVKVLGPIRFYVDQDVQAAAKATDADSEDDDSEDVDAFVVAPSVPSRRHDTQGASGSRAPTEGGRFMRAFKSMFCMVKQTHHRQYRDHVRSKTSYKRELDARRAQGEEIPAGSEEKISDEGSFEDPYGWLAEVSSASRSSPPPES